MTVLIAAFVILDVVVLCTRWILLRTSAITATDAEFFHIGTGWSQ